MENFEDFQHTPENTPEEKENTHEDFAGWKTARALFIELHASYTKIRKIADRYRESNPEYFKKKKQDGGNNFEHFAPELVEIIKKEIGNILEEYPVAPEDWRTKFNLVKELDTHEGVIERAIDQYRQSNLDEIKNFISSNARIFEYYSPKLIGLIKKFKEENDPSLLPGWKTNSTLARELDIRQEKARELASKYESTYPEYFKNKKIKNEKTYEYYSPELCQLIKKDLEIENKDISFVPEGWSSRTSFVTKFNLNTSSIEKIADRYRESNPEYFKKFKSNTGIFEYYSPELTSIISQELQERKEFPEAPPGWSTNGGLSLQLDVKPVMINRIVERYRKSNPEYFKNFKAKNGPVREHYSPEVVAIIKEEIEEFKKILPAPEDWKSYEAMIREVGKPKEILKTVAEYRDTHPEYLRKFKDLGGTVREYYSPELVVILKNKATKISEAPDNWRTQESLFEKDKISYKTIKKIVDKYRQTNPKYIHLYRSARNQTLEHYSPELVKEILDTHKNEIASNAPEGWKTYSVLTQEFGASEATIKKIAESYLQTHPEYFKKFRGTKQSISEHYSPELVSIIAEEVIKIKEIPIAPPGWKTRANLEKEDKVHWRVIDRIVGKYRETNPEYFKMFRKNKEAAYEYYSPELVQIIHEEKQKIKERRKEENKKKSLQYAEIPEGWKMIGTLEKELEIGRAMLLSVANSYRSTNPEYFKKFKNKRGRLYEYYSPEFEALVKEKFLTIPSAKEGFTDWRTAGRLSTEVGIYPITIKAIAEKYRETHPDYFKYLRDEENQTREYFSPEIIKAVKEYSETPSAEQAEYAGWKHSWLLCQELNTSRDMISTIVGRYRNTHPQFFKNLKTITRGTVKEHFSPELVQIITSEIFQKKAIEIPKKQAEILRASLENFVQEIADAETNNEQAKKIGEIIRLLPGNAHDILLRYHPEYKGMPVGYVKKIIADYLGDFMLARRDWRAEDVEKFREVMDIKNIKEAILFNLKNACLGYVNLERKKNSEADERALVEEYFNKKEMTALAESSIPEVASAITELHKYYREIFELKAKKPDNIVDALKGGRVFPDINQLLNIKEMKEKNKMLIADEMGLGKSASAILTKEYLGLRCAVVIVPSNVTDTWENYLSDKVSEEGKQLGYFKKGLAPKTLVIDSPKDLERLQKEVFDYIIISQERMAGKKYGDALEQVNFDMMIVDEVHKLKNIESGVRSETVMRLAEKIQGEDSYLALLSGTPIPNKVKDIAVCLKLLYPEKYREFDNKEMVNRILYGDLIDLRTELLMRTQMKELVTSIEMPKLIEIDIEVTLSPEEREMYEILLEEDELTASEKLILFRQFLLNPALIAVGQDFVGTKVKKLEQTLLEDLKTQDKIIVFVNDYINGVITGEQTIIDMMNLPKDVIIEKVYGAVDGPERQRIQSELKSKGQKTIVFVSGQTADVGVDFSGADGVIFYNEPWSKYTKNQQRGRVYREGLKHDLVSKTLITKNSLEDGIRRYTLAKEKAVEKLLRGISNTEAEKKLLYKDSKLAIDTVETNAELSQEYQSDWEKLMLHFGQGFESGEKKFKEDLDIKGKEYADLYRKLGRLTYQGNNARATATLLETMIAERNESVEKLRVIDIASGPEMLKEASSEKLRERIFSMDINAEHFTESDEKRKTLISSYLSLPSKDKSVDYCNLGFAYHQTNSIKYHKKNYERLQVLAEMNRVLRPGGRAVISMLHNVKFTNEEKLNELVEELGFKIIPQYSGKVNGGENYKAQFFTLEKVEDIPGYRKGEPQDIIKLDERLGRELLEGLEMKKLRDNESGLKDQRRMISTITVGGKEIPIMFNKKDKELYAEEVQSLEDGEALKFKHGGITNIPIEEIKAIGFERKMKTPGYYLLYKVIKGGGAVIIRGDYKNRTAR